MAHSPFRQQEAGALERGFAHLECTGHPWAEYAGGVHDENTIRLIQARANLNGCHGEKDSELFRAKLWARTRRLEQFGAGW